MLPADAFLPSLGTDTPGLWPKTRSWPDPVRRRG